MSITSTYALGEVQADGRRYVKETHMAEDGRMFDYEYLADNTLDPQLVMEERAVIIQARLLARAAARAAVVGTEVPWTKYEYLSRFTSAERVAIRTRAKTDPVVEDYMELMNASGGIYPALARPGLAYLASLGDITPERAAVIGNDA